MREVTTIEELDALDEASVISGYHAGRRNEADFQRQDKAYWHGYLNGLVDGRHVTHPSEAQMKLAHEMLKAGRNPFAVVPPKGY